MILEQLERQVTKLSAAELREFSAWFEQHMADAWDRQIEEDASNGGIDRLVMNLGIDLSEEAGPLEQGFLSHAASNRVEA